MATIKVLEGRNFKSTDPNGLSDPYCLIGAAHPETHEFVDEKICIRTETKRWTLSPVWKKGVIELQKVPRFVRVEVWDKDEEKEDDFVGFALVDLATARGTEDKWIPLLPKPNAKKEALGEVHIIIQMHDATAQAPKNPTPSPAKAAATQPPVAATQPPPASAKPAPAPTSQHPPATSKPSPAPSPAPSNPPPASAKPSPAPTSQPPPASSKPSPAAPSPAPSNPPPASSKPSPAPSPSPSNPPPASAKPSPVPVPSEKEKKEEAQKRLAEEERIRQEREKKSKEEAQKRAKEEEERKKREQEKRKREDVEKRPKQIADADKHAKLAASYHKQGFVMEALEHYNISAYLYAHLYGSGDKRTIASENAALSLMMGVTFGGAMV